jgi:hypothetical protein
MEMATFSPLLISNSNAPASLACRLYLPLFRRLLYHPIAVLNTSPIAPCALRLPLIWQNTSIHCLQWVAAAASPDTSPLTPLGMGAYSAVRQIPHLRSEACRCCPDFARGEEVSMQERCNQRRSCHRANFEGYWARNTTNGQDSEFNAQQNRSNRQ